MSKSESTINVKCINRARLYTDGTEDGTRRPESMRAPASNTLVKRPLIFWRTMLKLLKLGLVEWEVPINLGGSWCTCVVGEKYDFKPGRLPRSKTLLYDLGSAFSRSMDEHDLDRAEGLLKQIEDYHEERKGD